MDLWRAFRDGGSADMLNLLLAAAGIALAVLAFLKARGTGGRKLGVAAVSVGVAILLMGTLGSWAGRKTTDGAISGESVMQSQKDRIQREGYSEARCALDFGLAFALIPVLLGGAALLTATRKEKRDVTLPAGLLGVAGLLAVLDIATIARPLPGRDLPMGDSAWHVVDAFYLVTRCNTPSTPCAPAEWTNACTTLDAALHPPPGSTFYGVPQSPPDVTKIPDIDVPKLVDTCRAHPPAPARSHG